MPCCASPPNTFCQEKVATSSLVQSMSCANAAEVASQMVRPLRFPAIQSPSGTRTPDVVPFQAKTTSRSKSAEVRQLAIGRDHRPYIGKLELLENIDHPFLT